MRKIGLRSTEVLFVWIASAMSSLLLACSSQPGSADASAADAATTTIDAPTTHPDAPHAIDAIVSIIDARVDAPLLAADARVAVADAVVAPADATLPDATVPDAAVPDAAVPDAAVPDAAIIIDAAPDASPPDAGPPAASYTITVPTGESLIANQVNTGSNTLDEVLPSIPSGTTLDVLIDPTDSAATFTFFDGNDSPDGGIGWYDGNGDHTSYVFAPGSGLMITNNSGDSFDLTFTGTLPTSNASNIRVARV